MVSLQQTKIHWLISVLLLQVLINTVVWADPPAFTLELSDETIWQREQLIVTLKVQTDDPFARLEVGEFKQQGFSITPLSIESLTRTKTEAMSEASTKQSLRTLKKQWAVFSFIAGNHKLQLPRIRYRPNHGRIQTLDITKPNLRVKPLPIYVSPTVPVGKIHLKQSWQNGFLITTNELKQWTLLATGKGVVGQTMPPLIHQIKSNDSYKVFPAKSIRTQLDNGFNKKKDIGITSQLEYQIPIKVIRNGRLDLPTLSVQYFDPEIRKLVKTRIRPPFVIALDQWLQRLLIGLLISSLLFVFYIMFNRLKQYLAKRKLYMQVYKDLANATTYTEIHQAIRLLSTIKNWGENITLADFSTQWIQQKGNTNGQLEGYVKELQAAAFSKQKNHSYINKTARRILTEIQR